MPNCPQIHLNLYSRSSAGASGSVRERSLAVPRRPWNRRGDRGSSRFRPRPARPRGRGIRRASAPLQIPPMPTIGNRPRRATERTCPSATGRTAGPERPPCPLPSAGSPRGGVDRAPLQRVDQRDRVRPAPLGAERDRGRVGGVGRQLHDQRLRAQRPQHLHQRLRLARLLADDQPRVDVGAGDVELDGGDLLAPRHRLDQARELGSPPVAITETISGTGSSASRGRSSSRNPSGPRLGSPIEFIIPAGVSQIRRGALPARGSGVIVFETKAVRGSPRQPLAVPCGRRRRRRSPRR